MPRLAGLFTADMGPDGEIVALEGPYNRDARLIARLNGPTLIALRWRASSIDGMRGGGPAGGAENEVHRADRQVQHIDHM